MKPVALSAFSLAVLLAACTAPADRMPFLGSWDCGVTVMTFTPDGYRPSPAMQPIPVRYETEGDVTTITLADGAIVRVQVRDGDRMVWLSHSTGDSFDCQRVTG